MCEAEQMEECLSHKEGSLAVALQRLRDLSFVGFPWHLWTEQSSLVQGDNDFA